MATRASSIIRALHWGLFLAFFVAAVYSYHHLSLLASQVQWGTDPFGNRIPVAGYEEVMLYKAKALAVLLSILAGVFLTEQRFWQALSWLKKRPQDKGDLMKFTTGLMVMLFLVVYIGLTAKYIMVVRSIGGL